MIKSAFGVFCMLLFIGCKKDGASPRIQFKVNGTLVQLEGGRDTTQMDPITGAYYGCYATKPTGSGFYTIIGESKNVYIHLVISTQGTLLTNYNYTGGSADAFMSYNDTSYGSGYSGSESINVSSFSNELVNGTFSATVEDTSLNAKTVTQGQFNNIRVF
jgi:hypothetical protein